MVVWYKGTSKYDYNFPTVTYSWLNRYPNPYSKHVISVDTLESTIDENGNLHITKLIRKQGNVPGWAKPFLNNITDSWIVEKAVINPKDLTMQTYTRNLDHTGIIRVEEHNFYQYNHENSQTSAKSKVKFSSGFTAFYGISIKDRIETWSHSKFTENIKRSREGFLLVMQSFHSGSRAAQQPAV